MSTPPRNTAVSLTCCGIFHTVRTRRAHPTTPGHAAPHRKPETVVPEAMRDTPVTCDVRDGVAWITLNRPGVLNALDTALAAALADHAERAAADGTVTAVVVRGAGRAFCSGMDRTAL